MVALFRVSVWGGFVQIVTSWGATILGVCPGYVVGLFSISWDNNHRLSFTSGAHL